MNFLRTFFTPAKASASSGFLLMNVRCKKCGEVIEARINMNNDLSVDYDDRGREIGYISRKGIIGSGRCYQPLEIDLRFDMNRKLIEKTIANGEFVE